MFGPGKDIGGVKFTIPSSLAQGTNLGKDSYFSVEELASSTSLSGTCSAKQFLELGPGEQVKMLKEGDTAYSFASSTGAAAGNRYEEEVFAIPGTTPCMAVRYFIHYGVFENYSPGSVREFDEAALLAQFDAMRRTLTLGQ